MDELRTYDSVRGGRRQVFIPPEVPIDVLEAIRASKEGHVLISGATGTGKDLLADFLASEWMHDGRSGIVHVLNCGALEENSIRSEMFGHIKGSFSDAVQDRDGILLSCQGGIIILSDLDQLNSRDQELMLGYIQTGEIRPFGSDVPRKVPNPPRLLATTSTDVEAESDLLSKLLQQFKWKVRLAKFSDQRSKIPTLLKVWLHDRGILVSGRLLIFAFAHDWRGNGLELQMFCDKALEYLAHDGGSVVHCREDLLKLPMDVFVRLNKYAYYLLHLHEKHHGLDVVERAKNDDALRLGLLLLWELVECSSEGRTKLAIPIDMLDSEELKCSLGIDGLPASYNDSSVADFLEAFAVAAYNPLAVYTDESEHDATLVQEGVYGMVPDLFLCEERAEISQEFADALSALMPPKFTSKPLMLDRREPDLSYIIGQRKHGEVVRDPAAPKSELRFTSEARKLKDWGRTEYKLVVDACEVWTTAASFSRLLAFAIPKLIGAVPPGLLTKSPEICGKPVEQIIDGWNTTAKGAQQARQALQGFEVEPTHLLQNHKKPKSYTALKWEAHEIHIEDLEQAYADDPAVLTDDVRALMDALKGI